MKFRCSILLGILILTNIYAVNIKAETAQIESSTISNSSKLEIANTSSQINDEVYLNWLGLALTLDSSGTLHIPGGTASIGGINDSRVLPLVDVRWSDGLSHEEEMINRIKRVSIEGPLILENNAAMGMFRKLSNLTSIEGLSNVDVSNASELTRMFENDSSLTELDLSSFNTSNIKSMTGMFSGTTSLSKLKLGVGFKFISTSSSPNLPDILTTDIYTGKWINIGSGTEDNPSGSNVWTSLELMGNYNGSIDADTYSWQKVAPQKGEVIVKYIDTEGNTIGDEVIKTGNIGEDYTTDQKEIDGYTIKEIQGNVQGKYTSQAQTVIYMYTKNSIIGGNVIAKYTDTAGNKISDDVIKVGNIGEVYATNQKDIPGYTFKEVHGKPTGQFTDQAQTVTYVYTKNELPHVIGTVIVKYIDTNGYSISEDIVKSGTVGESYSTEKKAIKGYTFKEVQGSSTGQFKNQVQTVTYVYAKNKANTVNSEPKPENKSGSKDKDNNQGTTFSKQHGLPETGENERMTMMSIILGLILLAMGVVVSIFRVKKVNK